MPAAIAALRANRLRVSAARRVVLEALLAAPGPATADELATGFGGRSPESDLASMYRNLDTFERLGLVRHVQFGPGAARYVLSSRCAGGYVTCARCGSFDDLDAAALEALRRAVVADTSYDAGFTPLTLVGLCAHCS